MTGSRKSTEMKAETTKQDRECAVVILSGCCVFSGFVRLCVCVFVFGGPYRAKWNTIITRKTHSACVHLWMEWSTFISRWCVCVCLGVRSCVCQTVCVNV